MCVALVARANAKERVEAKNAAYHSPKVGRRSSEGGTRPSETRF